MAGYTPVFECIYDGTLCGKWPTAVVWASLLPLIDSRGELRMSYEAIAVRTGWPMELLRQGIHDLMQPDPDSQSPAEEGRRLVLLDPTKTWGWRAVNHALYREKARLMAKSKREVESGANKERLTAAHRRSPPDSAVTASDPLSDSYTDSNKEEKEKEKKGEGARKRASSRSTNGKKPKTALPEGFALDGELRTYAEERLPQVDVAALFESFCGKARAKSWVYADWRQAWQEFCRNTAPGSGHWAAGQYPQLKPQGANAEMVFAGKPVKWQ